MKLPARLARLGRQRPAAAEIEEEIAKVFAVAAAAAEAGDDKRFHDLLRQHSDALRRYLLGFVLEGSPAAFTASYVGDACRRFLQTLSLVPLPSPARILEVGSNPYFFHILLHKLFPKSRIEGANFFDRDIFSTRQGSIVQTIRHQQSGEELAFSSRLFSLETVTRYPYDESSFDLIFFCETLEHLVVDPLATFGRLKRILRPGGCVVITLPNAVRLYNFALMLHGHNFYDAYNPDNGVHGRHNREFTLAELKTLLQQRGFEVLRAETLDRYDYEQVDIVTLDYTGRSIVVPERRRALLNILRQSGGTLEDRGDNLYLLARKPTPAEPRSFRQPPEDAPADSRVDAATLAGWESGRLVVTIDRFEDSPHSVAVSGWVLRRDGDSARQSTHLILEAPDASYSFRAKPEWRADAADTHGLAYDDAGFHIELDKTLLAPGRYRLGVAVHAASGKPAFERLALEIEIGAEV